MMHLTRDTRSVWPGRVRKTAAGLVGMLVVGIVAVI